MRKSRIESWIEKQWYSPRPTALVYGLMPLAFIFSQIVKWRRFAYQKKWFKSYRAACPVIVVGNLSVGGVGKTPLVIALYFFLKERGWTPGIISRGYKGTYKDIAWVATDSDPRCVGDESILLAVRTGAPVVVSRDRSAALKALTNETACDIILSDDGLQHYAMARDLEIVVIDTNRKLGNQLCLPAGPLREPASRLQEVDLVVINGGDQSECAFALSGISLINLLNPSVTQSINAIKGKKIHAIAGIGAPSRFFDYLKGLGAEVVEHAFSDHYCFQESDLKYFGVNDCLVMTEKDAVKCKAFAKENMWFFPVEAHFNAKLTEAFENCLQHLVKVIE